MNGWLKFLIALVAGVVIGLIVQDWGIGILAGIVALVITSVLVSTRRRTS